MIREAIKKRLIEKKISQRRCALDNDIDYNNFNKFLLGKRALPFDDLEKVLKYLLLRVTQ